MDGAGQGGGGRRGASRHSPIAAQEAEQRGVMGRPGVSALSAGRKRLVVVDERQPEQFRPGTNVSSHWAGNFIGSRECNTE